MSYDAFLSYSGHDLHFAEWPQRRLRRFRLGGRPLRVFFAPAEIEAGQSIPRRLSQALQDSRHLVAVVTPAWLESEWCRLEEEVATWLDPAGQQQRLLPLLLMETPMPPALARLKYIDFRREALFDRSLQELVDAIRTGAIRQLAGRRVGQRKCTVSWICCCASCGTGGHNAIT